jgi:hypothetical protein
MIPSDSRSSYPIKEGATVRKLVVASVAAVALATAGPAFANNDPTVPADECSGNPNAVGQPQSHGGTNATDIGPSPVAGPASANNPGKSTGAKGQLKSQATTTGNCEA